MESLRERTDESQLQIGRLTDLCQYVSMTHENFCRTTGDQVILNSVLAIVEQEARRVERDLDAIFNDKRVIQLIDAFDDMTAKTANRA